MTEKYKTITEESMTSHNMSAFKQIGLIGVIIGSFMSIGVTVHNHSLSSNIETTNKVIAEKKPNLIYHTGMWQPDMLKAYNISVKYDIQNKKFIIQAENTDSKYIKLIEDAIKQSSTKKVNGMTADEYFARILKYNPSLVNHGYTLLELQRMNILIEEPIAVMRTVPTKLSQPSSFDFINKYIKSTNVIEAKHIISLKNGKTYSSPNLISDIKQGKLVTTLYYSDF